MKRKFLFLVGPMILASTHLKSQVTPELMGLAGKEITSMEIWESLIVLGTNGDGVFYQYLEDLPDSGWIHMGLEGKNVTAVYPHKSGPGPVGWGVTAGVSPAEDDSIYVYCSFMGAEFVPNSMGITDSLAEGVYSLAGFPDPSICGEKFAATGGALYRQLLGDSLWVPVYEKKGDEGSGVIQVQTKEHAGGLVLAGGSYGITGVLLIESTDYGDSWEHLYPPGPAIAFDFDVNPSGELQTVFVSHGDRISRSLNGGDSWDIVFGAGFLTYDIIYDIHYDPLTEVLLAGGGIPITILAHGAVLVWSIDLGETWDILSLPGIGPIVSVGLASDGYVYFAIPGSGVFRVSLGELSLETEYVPQSFVLLQPYPNPFNPTASVEFSVPRSGIVTITVYDLLGREVERILNQQMSPGHHKVQWNAGQVPSGIYFVRMQSGSGQVFTQTRKLTVLR